MKVVALVETGYTAYRNRFLVEMTADEFSEMSGIGCRDVGIGTEANPVKLLKLLTNVRDGMKSAERASGSFRALADLVEQCVEQAKVAVTDEAKAAVEQQEVQS